MASHPNKKVLIIFNPTAGRKILNGLDKIIRAIKKYNIEVDMAHTQHAGHAREIARDANNDDYDLIVAAGGDGTINEVINGLYPRKTALAIIPLGTANVLASEIGLKNTTSSIVDYLVGGIIKPIWLGVANEKYFALMLSVGADAHSVAKVSSKLKRSIGKYAYLISYVKSVFCRPNALYQVTIDGDTYQGSNVIVSNGRYYGGKYLCAPDADIREQKLYVTLAQKKGAFNAIKYAILMFAQKYLYSKTVMNMPANRVEIKSDMENEPIQVDGDHFGELPVDVSISQDYINLLFPS